MVPRAPGPGRRRISRKEGKCGNLRRAFGVPASRRRCMPGKSAHRKGGSETMKKRYLLIGAAILVAGGATGGVVLRGRAHKPLEVQTAKVDRQKIVQKVSATGKIQPKTKVKISADVSGKIKKLCVVDGQWVEKGAFLVGLDRERYLAAVESAEANVRSAQANATLVRHNVERAEKEFRRSEGLLAQGLESQAVFDTQEGRSPGRAGASQLRAGPGGAGRRRP